jgi:polysaccharide biosynthesis protein PslE
MKTLNLPATIAQVERSEVPMEDPYHGGFLRDFLHVVFKRKWFVLFFFLSTSATVAAVTLFLMKPTYVANTQFLLSLGREHISDLTLATGGAVAPRFNSNMDEQIARSIELLTGHYLAERVVQTIGSQTLYPRLREESTRLWNKFLSRPALDESQLFELAVERLMNNVAVEAAGKSSLVNLSFRHENPEMAAKVTNLLASLYVERHLGVLKNPKTDAFFQEQFQNLKQKLRESEDKLEAFKRRYSIVTSVEDEQELALKQELSLRSILNDTRSQQAEFLSRIGQLRQQLANTAQNPGTTTILRDKLTTLELQENEMALRYKAENPTLRALREEIRLVREKVAQQEASKSYGNSATTSGTLFAQLQQELLRNESEYKALRAREEAHASKLKEFQDRLSTLEQVSVEFNHLKQASQADEQNNRLYQTKFEELRISNAMDAEKIAGVRVIEPARIPSSPIDSKKTFKLLAGMLFGLLGGIAFAIVAHLMSGKLETTDDVQRYLNLPVLASIPRLRMK